MTRPEVGTGPAVLLTAKEARELAERVSGNRERKDWEYAQSVIGQEAACGKYSATLDKGNLDWLKHRLEGLGYKVTPRQESALGGTELRVEW